MKNSTRDWPVLLETRRSFASSAQINERLRVLRMMDFAIEERVTQTGEQHIEILIRISDGDAVGARRELMRNIEIGRKNVNTTIKEALLRGFLMRGENDQLESAGLDKR